MKLYLNLNCAIRFSRIFLSNWQKWILSNVTQILNIFFYYIPGFSPPCFALYNLHLFLSCTMFFHLPCLFASLYLLSYPLPHRSLITSCLTFSFLLHILTAALHCSLFHCYNPGLPVFFLSVTHCLSLPVVLTIAISYIFLFYILPIFSWFGVLLFFAYLLLCPYLVA